MGENISFLGPLPGTTNTIRGVTSTAWGQLSDGGEIWGLSPTDGASATINVLRSDHQIAPEGVLFYVTLAGFSDNTPVSRSVYDVSYHKYLYFWDFGEGYTFVAPAQVIALDAVDGGKRSNSRYMQGPLGAHVFRTPGSHLVRLAVIDPVSGDVAIASTTIVVSDPDSAYAGTDTIFLDSTGIYANDSGGWDRHSTLTSAFTALKDATNPKRIVAERGQVHTINSQLNFRPPSGASAVSFRIEALDVAGDKPEIHGTWVPADAGLLRDGTFQNGFSGNSGMVLQNLKITGTWDTTTETYGASQTGTYGLSGVEGGDNKATSWVIDQVDFDGLYRGIDNLEINDPWNGKLAHYNDVSITNWRDYALWNGGHGNTALIGSRLSQHVDAIHGGDKDGAHNNHSCYRCPNDVRSIVWGTDTMSNTGWFPESSGATGVRGAQPSYRWGTSLQQPGAQLNMGANVMEGAGGAIVTAAKNEDTDSHLVNAVIQGNYCMIGSQGKQVVNITHGGQTIRDNMCIYPDTDYNISGNPGLNGGSNGGPNCIVAVDNDRNSRATAACIAAPIDIYNNTVVNLSSATFGGIYDTSAPHSIEFTTVNIANNLVHEPLKASPNVPYDPMAASEPFTSPKYKGYRLDASTLFAEHGTPADAFKLWSPAVGSPARDGATGTLVSATSFGGGYDEADLHTTGRDVGATQS
ncbi:hypothetical protein [Primorskyibacter marinus]|uniref:hypothetical protein n=1 Tax=Primorskyibacter marinus TaxID=1977320 RepID=UPI000E303362|nr:hypothetical protein [Primorskyibacter marinus]